MTKRRSGSRPRQARLVFRSRWSTPRLKSAGKPILKTVLGSYSARGKKKRRNIRKLTPRYPQISAQTILRRPVLMAFADACPSGDWDAAAPDATGDGAA